MKYNESQLSTFLKNTVVTSRKFILNGKLELFLIRCELKKFEDYLKEFCDINDDVSPFLKAMNFSLILQENEQSESEDRHLTYVNYNKSGQEIIFSKEKTSFFVLTEEWIYYMVFLPVNFETNSINTGLMNL